MQESDKRKMKGRVMNAQTTSKNISNRLNEQKIQSQQPAGRPAGARSRFHHNDAGSWKESPATAAMTPKAISRLKRKVGLLKKSGMFDTQDTGITIERATSAQELKEAYSLVHDVYEEQGYILEQHGRVRVRAFEASPDTATFVARKDGKVIAVSSLVIDSPDLGLPSDHVFGDAIDLLRDPSQQVCEVTNLVVHPDYRNSPLFVQITRVCFTHALVNGCANMFIAISPGHAKFFREIFRFDDWGGQRSYSDEVEDIVEGMRLNVANCQDLFTSFDRMVGQEHAFLCSFYLDSNPFIDQIEGWTTAAEKPFRNPLVLRDLFILTSRLLLDCPDEELDAIESRWGSDVFWGVWGEPQHVLPEARSAGAAAAATQSP